MPIVFNNDFRSLTQDEFMAIDFHVMRHAFSVHNRYGSLCDEKVYADEMAYLCACDQMEVCREAQIKVTHKLYNKLYYVDLMVENGAAYEFKSCKAIADQHKQQLLNYLIQWVNFQHHSVVIKTLQ